MIMLNIFTLAILAYTIYNVVRLEQKVNELQDEVHALNHSFDIEIELIKNKIDCLEEQHGKEN